MASSWEIDVPSALTDHQAEQVRKALKPIGCLTGGPGTGKTFATAQIIHALRRQSPPPVVAVCAPTAKAALRLFETYDELFGAWIPTGTIHSLLMPRNFDGTVWTFSHTHSAPLPHDFVIVDEASMIDVPLAADLLDACNNDTRVLFVGDADQLPPVGPGRPFYDLLQSPQVGVGRLTEIHRYAGRIAHACKAIRDGQSWEPSPKLDWRRQEHPENLKHVEATNAPATLGAIVRAFEALTDHFEPSDIQVIAPVNKKGSLSRQTINRTLQDYLNPEPNDPDELSETESGIPLSNSGFRRGDRIICRKNMKIDQTNDILVNGAIGTALSVDPKGKMLTANFDGRQLDLPRATWEDFQLAYCLTCHNAQGSQWPVVIVVADPYQGARFVCGRSWWYTALSRARKITITVGPRALITQDCHRQDIAVRRTDLARMLHEHAESLPPDDSG